MKKTLISFFLLVFINFVNADYLDYVYQDRDYSYNSLGQTGLIHLPSAQTKGNSSIFFTYNNSEFWKIGTLTVTPFDWLEASYFYYRPDDLLWGNSLGDYLDKGFNVKFSYKPFKNSPTFAIGLDDFAGTGQFTREYFVASQKTDYFNLSLGIGWGKYVGENTISNPLGKISDNFKVRPGAAKNYGRGGNPSYDLWFKGEAIAFGGIEIYIPFTKGLKLKIESNPFNYNKFSCCGEGRGPDTDKLRRKDSKINYGISMPIKEYGNLDLSYIKGNTLNLSFSVGVSFNKLKPPKEKFKAEIQDIEHNQDKKNEFYLDLLNNLNKNSIYLQTADLKIEDESVDVSVDYGDIRNPLLAAKRASQIIDEVAVMNELNLNHININQLYLGMQLHTISFAKRDIKENYKYPIELTKRNTNISSPEPYGHQNHEFKPIPEFPVVYNSISPEIRSHVGSPERFYYGGLGVKLDTEIQFTRNFVLSSRYGISLLDNFDEKNSDPNSVLPHVRTEIVSYLQATDNYLTKLQLDYYWSPYKNIYTRLTGGIFEMMYGGFGAEILYKPFNTNFSVGYESFKVKRRGYEQDFSFLDYEIITDHINLVYFDPNSRIQLRTSYGNYLAGDRGYTLDLSRKMDSGLQFGFFFSKTNVSAEDFGEGSFDKGFYFRIPNDLFSKKKSKANTAFSLKTLTRDGGQKLNIDNSLFDQVNSSSIVDINRGWYELSD